MSDPALHSGVAAGVDGSDESHLAARWAAHWAHGRNVALTLIHAVPPTPAGAVRFTSAATDAYLRGRQESRARTVIAAAIDAVSAGVEGRGPDVGGEVVHAAAVPALVEVSKVARLVVVGSRGLGAIGRTLLGSVSSGVLLHAHCPVAVIRDPPASARPDRLPVLVGIDGSPASAAATAIAFDEASWRGVDLIALHAWSDTATLPLATVPWADLQARADAVLAERLAGFQERYPDVAVIRRVVSQHPARHLLTLAESAQLVVVGSRGRGGFAGMLLGSVSSAVAHAAGTAVIVARPR